MEMSASGYPGTIPDNAHTGQPRPIPHPSFSPGKIGQTQQENRTPTRM
jgi:hypothetical protein